MGCGGSKEDQQQRASDIKATNNPALQRHNSMAKNNKPLANPLAAESPAKRKSSVNTRPSGVDKDGLILDHNHKDTEHKEAEQVHSRISFSAKDKEKERKGTMNGGNGDSTQALSLVPSSSSLKMRKSSGSDKYERYLPTHLVKPKGHRVRIEASLKSNPVYLIVPPAPLHIITVKTVDNCEWGKLHPSMFPSNFKGCNVMSEGWTLLQDNTHANTPLMYWKKSTN